MVLMSSGSGGSLEATPTPRAWNSRKGQRSTCLKRSQEEKPERQVGEGQKLSSFCPQDRQNLSLKEAAGLRKSKTPGQEKHRRGPFVQQYWPATVPGLQKLVTS